MGCRNGLASRVPTISFTHVRKVEPMGSDCIRMYCSVIKDGSWEDRVIIEMTVSGVVGSSEFVNKSLNEILGDASPSIENPIRVPLIH